jgi:predicted DNA-binding transcriptional regulator AlpA
MNQNHEHDNTLLRLKDIIGDRKAHPPTRGLLPMGASTWWQLVQNRVAPKPLKLGRASYWRARDVHALIERLDRDGAIPVPRRAGRRATPSQPAGARKLIGGRANATF